MLYELVHIDMRLPLQPRLIWYSTLVYAQLKRGT